MADQEVQFLWKGKRLYGMIHRFDDGRVVYLAKRKQDEIFRSGKATISDAIRDDSAAWAIDDETLLMLRAKGIRFVGVRVVDTGDMFLTVIDKFFDKGPAKRWRFHDYTTRGGSPQRLLPLSEFRFQPGPGTIAKVSHK